MNPKKIKSNLYPLLFCCICLTAQMSCSESSQRTSHNTWTHYAGSSDQSKYFESEQITPENVHLLEVSWFYPTEDNVPYFFSPIIVDTVMYVMGKNSSLIALNVKNGEEIWIHSNLNGLTKRGINYWESQDKSDRRLIFTINNTIQAIDALTGQSILSFGENGYVDLREGLDRAPSSIRRIQPMMPGVLYEDLLIIGSATGENYFSPPGHIRAYNVITGEMEWIFHSIPHPGEFGYETWPKDAYKYAGGVNVWSEITVDSEKGIAFLPIGSPTYDYYGADRLGSNLFGNSLVALDAKTGERLWHFQTVHHDLWDYDLSPAPQLLTLNRNGKKIDAVAIATKHGFVFVFDRVTGEPVFPIEEKPFPASEMPGEEAWPTQPISSLPRFTRNEVTLETLNPYFPDSIKQVWQKRLSEAKSGLYIPPSDKYETVMMPGALGGSNYGNTAADPDKGILYILTQEHASIYKLNKVEPPKLDLSVGEIKRVKTLYTASCQSCHGIEMEGGVGPPLQNIGEHLFYDEFRSTVLNGKGQMPGFVHVDEETLKALYRYLGGNPRTFNIRRNLEAQEVEGPVVASGGVKILPDENHSLAMSDYPNDVEHPDVRFTTDYGLDWPGLAAPPWSSILAYDLNNGTIKWRRPVGQDSLYAQGDQSLGAPGGVLRKGMIVTSTGVVFTTAKGGKLYALDAESGEILWEETSSNEINAQPSMYTLDGNQYLVINATSNFARDSYNHSKKPNALPKGYVIYSLPKNKLNPIENQ